MADSPDAFRDDLAAAVIGVVENWADPGDWWTGAERLAIVEEFRRAVRSDPLPAWIAPTTVDGLIETNHVLPPAAIDAIWRIANHPGTITESWFESIIARGISAEAYVELVAVAATTAAIDTLHRALGRPLPLPPTARVGDPSRIFVDGAERSSHWVPTVGDTGAAVMRSLSAIRAGSRQRAALVAAMYIPAEAIITDMAWSRDTLDRMQLELVAARTSLHNECFY